MKTLQFELDNTYIVRDIYALVNSKDNTIYAIEYNKIKDTTKFNKRFLLMEEPDSIVDKYNSIIHLLLRHRLNESN